MAAHRSLYNILNVSPDAEPVVIEAAYRALMKKYHPDQGGGDHAADAAEINAAFATLREPERRAAYDRREWERQQEMLLARYAPAEIAQHHTGIFGWTGWATAAVLGGVMLVTVGPSKQASPALQAAVQTAAAEIGAPTPGFGADEAEEIFFTPAAVVRNEAPAPVAEAPAAVALPPAGATQRPAQTGSAATKPHRSKRPTQRSAPSEEREFLERQGYIY
ncbi:J domain-containing protein [Sphingomonas parva]|nr:DnaJ domain-containing protein [Sphingomonas parva]